MCTIWPAFRQLCARLILYYFTVYDLPHAGLGAARERRQRPRRNRGDHAARNPIHHGDVADELRLTFRGGIEQLRRVRSRQQWAR